MESRGQGNPGVVETLPFHLLHRGAVDLEHPERRDEIGPSQPEGVQPGAHDHVLPDAIPKGRLDRLFGRNGPRMNSPRNTGFRPRSAQFAMNQAGGPESVGPAAAKDW